MKIANAIQTIDGLYSSFNESIRDSKSLKEKWQAVENYIIDVSALQSLRREKKDAGLTDEEKLNKLADFIQNSWHWCPFKDESGVDFERECVGFRFEGCKECMLRNLEKL